MRCDLAKSWSYRQASWESARVAGEDSPQNRLHFKGKKDGQAPRPTEIECLPSESDPWQNSRDWTGHVKSLGEGLLSNEVDSWMTGINHNVEGKTERIVARYSGSAPAYWARCDAVAEGGYREMWLG